VTKQSIKIQKLQFDGMLMIAASPFGLLAITDDWYFIGRGGKQKAPPESGRTLGGLGVFP
jgi:hypothetical protein